MQPATHVLDPSTEAGERGRLEIDVTELDHASPGCTDEPVVLPLDASVTDGALRVVPDSELGTHFRPCRAGGAPIHRTLPFSRLCVIALTEVASSATSMKAQGFFTNALLVCGPHTTRPRVDVGLVGSLREIADFVDRDI